MKKKLCIVLYLLMVVISISGCTIGNKGGSKDNVTDDKEATKTEEVAVKDYGEIRALFSPSFDKAGFHAGLEYISEQCGVKIIPVWSDSPAGGDKFTLMIAAGEDIDTHVAPITTFNTYLTKNMLLKLDEYIDEAGLNLVKKIRPDLWNWAKRNGNSYGIPLEQATCSTSIGLRKDWLDEIGSEIPKTYDEFKQVLIKMKEQYNVNPLMVQLQRTGRQFDIFMGGAFLPMGMSWWKNDEGVYLPPEMHPEYVNIILELKNWYDLGLISPDSIGIRGNIKGQIEANKVGAVMDSYALAQNFSRDAVKTMPNLKWINLDPLNGKYDNGGTTNMAPGNFRVVNVNAKNPEGVVKVMDWIAESLENTIISRQGIPNVHWEYINKNGPKPTSFTNAENLVKLIDIPNAEDKFPGGGMEWLDINNYTERQDTSDVYLLGAYDWWEKTYGNKIKTYITIDDKYAVVEQNLSSISDLNACKTALEEMTISIIMGSKDISEWDNFMKEYLKIGMQKVIDEKNKIYAEVIK